MFSRSLLTATLLSLSLHRATATCLLDVTAQKVAQNFATLFSNYSPQFANQVLTPDFVDQSDSVDWLISNGTNCPKPLGSNTFNSRAEYEAGQATQPDMPFVIENVYHDCTNVFVRWKFAVQPQQVQGIAILGTVFNPGNLQQPYLIKHVFSEFNTGAFITNLGYYQGTSPCTTGNSGSGSGSGNSQQNNGLDLMGLLSLPLKALPFKA